MATFNFKFENFIQTPDTGDNRIRLYDKYDNFKYNVTPRLAYFYYKNNYIIIKQEDCVDINLDFETPAIAIQALQKLNTIKKELMVVINDQIDYYTRDDLKDGALDLRYFTNTAITELINGLTLDELYNVDVSGVTEGEVLSYSGGTWVPIPNSTTYSTLDSLLDVTVTGVVNSDILIWNSGTSLWENGQYVPDLSNYYTTAQTQTILSVYYTSAETINVSNLTNYWTKGDTYTRFEISRLGESPYYDLVNYLKTSQIQNNNMVTHLND